MEKLEIGNELTNEINNNYSIKLYEEQKNFLQTDLGKTINSALDIGLKVALPNLIEDQIIDIKNTILEQGFKEGVKEVINSGIDIGKSMLGVVTGNFENISQVQMAVKNGGVLDSISKLLDMSINLARDKNLINSTVSKILKQSKNTIISSISDKVEETLTNQLKAVDKLQNYCEKWNECYGSQDFSGMDRAYKNMQNYLNKTMPIENTIKEARKIENIHNLIKNNGKNFNISNEELILAKKLN